MTYDIQELNYEQYWNAPLDDDVELHNIKLNIDYQFFVKTIRERMEWDNLPCDDETVYYMTEAFFHRGIVCCGGNDLFIPNITIKDDMKIKLTEEQISNTIKEVIEGFVFKKRIIEHVDPVKHRLHNKLISEGLIKSFSLSDVEHVLLHMGIQKYDVKPSYLPSKNSMQGTLIFRQGVNGMSRQFYDEILHRIDALGWYVSQIYHKCKEYDYDTVKNFQSFMLVFEPKFDVLVSLDDIQDNLYHILPKRLIEKVLKKGLTPKDGSMYSNHPERVYMFVGKPWNWKEIANGFKKGKNINEPYCLLEIDTNELNKNNRLFVDQNTNDYKAVYTLEPIPPMLIKVIDSE